MLPLPTRPRSKWPLVLAAVVLIGGGGVAVWLLTRDVPVPKLHDLTLVDATVALEKAGLRMKSPASTRPTAEVQPGRVIDSDPPAGKKVGKGTEVAVFVAVPAPLAPRLLGNWTNTDPNAKLRRIEITPGPPDFMVVRLYEQMGPHESAETSKRIRVVEGEHVQATLRDYVPVGAGAAWRIQNLKLTPSADGTSLTAQGSVSYDPPTAARAESYTATLTRQPAGTVEVPGGSGAE